MELNLGLAILVSFRKSIFPDYSMSGSHKMKKKKKRCNCLKQHNISRKKRYFSWILFKTISYEIRLYESVRPQVGSSASLGFRFLICEKRSY